MELQDKISVNINDEDREFTMYFGLLNQLTRLVGSIENLQYITSDPNLRDATLAIVLAPKGVKPQDFDLASIEMSAKAAAALLAWASEHILDFFIEAATALAAVTERNQERLKALQPPSSGSNG